MVSEYKKCPKCGGRKPLLMACIDCNYNFLQERKKRKQKSKLTCPRCGAIASKNHIERKDCIPIEESNKKVKLPDWENTQPKNDIFDTGRVVSGGGFGVGKGKKK